MEKYNIEDYNIEDYNFKPENIKANNFICKDSIINTTQSIEDYVENLGYNISKIKSYNN